MRIEAVNRRRMTWAAACGLALVMLSGCAAQKAYTRAEREMRRQSYDAAVLNYSKALAHDPGNSRYEVALARAKLKASAEHFAKGTRFLAAGQLEAAIGEFQQTLLLNPDNQHARVELERALRALQAATAGPSEIELAKEAARRRDMGPPRLNAAANIPIVLDFQDVKLEKIFEAIGKAAGLNFIYDDKVDLDKTRTIEVGNVTLEKALDILMLQTKNFYKPIDEFTLLIAPDNRQKRQEYEDQVIRTFFLSNADTKTVVTLLRSLLQSRQIAENADLNSVTIKDTPSKVAIAERIIEANDKNKGEVLVDVELLEINRQTARTLGIDLSNKSLSLTFRTGESSVPLNGLDVLKRSGNWTVGPIPNVILNFLKTDSDTRTVAQPQLRVSEGEQAEILIGDRVPIPTTSFNTSQTVGGNIVPITSFTYQNVGITVQIEPRVHHNKEVTLKVQVEVSQISGQFETAQGVQPTIGTRQIQTVIRLRDGETNLLAGLIQRNETDSQSGVAGLSDLPILGKMLGNNTRNRSETDIILTLTPRIVRIPNITDDDLATLWVGTEEDMRLRGPARNALGEGPFSGEPVSLSGRGSGAGSGGGSSAGRIESTSVDGETADDIGVDPADEAVDDGSGDAGGGFDDGGAEVQPQEDEDPDPRRRPFDDDEDEPDDDTPPPPALVSLVPSKTSPGVGETLTVQVFLQNGTNVGSVPFHLRFNNEVLQYLPPGEEGPLLSSDGATTVFLSNESGGGEVVVGLSRMGGGEGVSGSGVIATFRFLCIGPGDAGFQFTAASVKDPQAQNLPAAFNTQSVQVGQ